MKDSKQARRSRSRKLTPVRPGEQSIEQRLGASLASYNEDFPSAAFPSFLAARDFEQLMGIKSPGSI